jgi:excinuclease ABC subunit C
MARENASIALRRFRDKLKREKYIADGGLKGIVNMLKLEKSPERIEAYDISNIGAEEKTGSMVVFRDGMPCSEEYRRFKIKQVEGQDDYASMQEIVYRRFRHAGKNNKDGDKGFSALPELILIDGGKGHVSSVKPVLRELDLNIPVYGMVKDDRHRSRGLVSEEGEYGLTGNIPVLRFITSIQDEAHRFAIEYGRRLARKRQKASVLDEIEGIGDKRRRALLKYFGSVGRIKAAAVDELADVKGISRTAAENVYNFFH